MVTDGVFRRPAAGVNAPAVDNRMVRRWGPAHPRQHQISENRHLQPRPPPRGYRANPNFRNGPPMPAGPPPQLRQIEVARVHHDKFPAPIVHGGQTNPKRPQFHTIYQEFEDMKKRGMVLNVEQQPLSLAPQARKDNPASILGERKRSPSEDFAEAMKIFMKSYLPTSSFANTKPVDDWSKEAGNLLNELTDKEYQSDLDRSVWKIPANNRRKSVSQAYVTTSRYEVDSRTTSPPAERESDASFDIHRHIMEIKPSPYPSGSPLSSGQSSSNHSSDNDADDESTQSSAENACFKTIGAKKSLKKRFHSSYTCSTMDSGYLSSANESDSARGGHGLNTRSCAASMDSDDLSSECGFTSSTCLSWPTSPLPPQADPAWSNNRDGRRFSDGPFGNRPNPVSHVDLSLQQQLHRLPLARPPIPPPMPPFLAGMPGIPIPPPTHILPAQFQPVASVAHSQITSMSRLPPPIPAAPGFALMGTPPPLPYMQQLHAASSHGTAAEPLPHDANGAYHKHKAWITDEILEMIAVRDRLYKRMKKHPAPDIVEMYKKVRNMVVGMTRNAKRSFEKQFEEQQLELQMQNSRQVQNFNLVNSLSIGVHPTYVPQTW